MAEVVKEALDSLSTARQSVLRTLKERGELSADELAQALGMTPSGARQHLAALRHEGLVEHRVNWSFG